MRPGVFRVVEPVDASLFATLDSPYVVVLPPSIADKGTFLDEMAKPFQFPGYYGRNWDALTDCLTDLYWFHEKPAHIVLIWPTPDHLLTAQPDDFFTALAILNEAVDRWWSKSVTMYVLLEDLSEAPALRAVPLLYP
jgi:RNAse (barnase) inhibitor barstar